MKKVLVFIYALLFLLACNKPKDSASDQKGTASFGAGGNGYFWSVPYSPGYKVDIINGHTSCILSSFQSNNPPYSGKIYTFSFSQVPGNYGVSFAIPATYPSFSFPLNSPMNFVYSPTNSYASIASVCSITFSSSESIIFQDSATVKLTITRMANKTIDGTFSFYLSKSKAGTSGIVDNGIFSNVPITIY